MVDFIKGEKERSETDDTVKLKASISLQDVLFPPKSHNGLGLQRVSSFWSAIKMGWLRRLSKPSFWKTLHIDPHYSNKLRIKKALKNMQNPVMKQIYISLLK